MHRVEISGETVKALKTICFCKSNYVTIALRQNKLILAVEDTEGAVCVIPVTQTDHPEFSTSVDKKLIQQLLVVGFLEVKISPDKTTVNFEIYKNSIDPECSHSMIVSYSTSVGLDNLIKMVTQEKLEPINIPHQIFSRRLKPIIADINSSLEYIDGYICCLGTGLSLYYKCDDKFVDKFSITPRAYSNIVENIDEYSVFFKCGVTYILQSGNMFFTWRGHYETVDDLTRRFMIKPLCAYRVIISDDIPFVKPIVVSNADLRTTSINLSTGKLRTETSRCTAVSSFPVQKILGDVDAELELDQKLLTYFSSPAGMCVAVYKKFIRIGTGNTEIEIGCKVNVL